MAEIIDKTQALGGRFTKRLRSVDGFIVHHTGGRGGVDGVIDTLRNRGLAVHYVIDRDGRIYQTLPDGVRGAHTKPGAKFKTSKAPHLSNSNTLGVEIIANDNADVLPAQVEAARSLISHAATQYGFDPISAVFGHGEVTPGWKQPTEGLLVASSVRGEPISVPAATGKKTPPAPVGKKLSSLSKPEAAKLQATLLNAGFDVGPKGIDGIAGKDTRAALAQFQQSVNARRTELGLKPIDATGVLDATTAVALGQLNSIPTPRDNPLRSVLNTVPQRSMRPPQLTLDTVIPRSNPIAPLSVTGSSQRDVPATANMRVSPMSAGGILTPDKRSALEAEMHQAQTAVQNIRGNRKAGLYGAHPPVPDISHLRAAQRGIQSTGRLRPFPGGDLGTGMMAPSPSTAPDRRVVPSLQDISRTIPDDWVESPMVSGATRSAAVPPGLGSVRTNVDAAELRAIEEQQLQEALAANQARRVADLARSGDVPVPTLSPSAFDRARQVSSAASATRTPDTRLSPSLAAEAARYDLRNPPSSAVTGGDVFAKPLREVTPAPRPPTSRSVRTTSVRPTTPYVDDVIRAMDQRDYSTLTPSDIYRNAPAMSGGRATPQQIFARPEPSVYKIPTVASASSEIPTVPPASGFIGSPEMAANKAALGPDITGLGYPRPPALPPPRLPVHDINVPIPALRAAIPALSSLPANLRIGPYSGGFIDRNSVNQGTWGAFGGTREQQARTAASLARMEQANRARYDRSARSRDDRGNTYNSRSTLSGRERVGLR